MSRAWRLSSGRPALMGSAPSLCRGRAPPALFVCLTQERQNRHMKGLVGDSPSWERVQVAASEVNGIQHIVPRFLYALGLADDGDTASRYSSIREADHTAALDHVAATLGDWARMTRRARYNEWAEPAVAGAPRGSRRSSRLRDEPAARVRRCAMGDTDTGAAAAAEEEEEDEEDEEEDEMMEQEGEGQEGEGEGGEEGPEDAEEEEVKPAKHMAGMSIDPSEPPQDWTGGAPWRAYVAEQLRKGARR